MKCEMVPGRSRGGLREGQIAAGQTAGTAAFAGAAIPPDLLTQHTAAAHCEGAIWGALMG